MPSHTTPHLAEPAVAERPGPRKGAAGGDVVQANLPLALVTHEPPPFHPPTGEGKAVKRFVPEVVPLASLYDV